MTLPLAINENDLGHIEDHEEIHDLLDDAKTITTGTLAARPAPGNAGDFYFATDVPALYFDSGSAWYQQMFQATSNTFTAINNFEDDVFFSSGKPWFDVQADQFGATGDGVTDDTAAVQAAIDACIAAGGGEVYFPLGSYLCTAVTIGNETGVILKGAGRPTSGSGPQSRLLYAGTGTRFLDLRSSSGVELRNLWIQSTSGSFSGSLIDCQQGAAATDTAYFRMSGCHVQGSGTGICLNWDKTIYSSVDDCNIFNGGFGIRGAASALSYCNGNTITSTRFGSSVTMAIRGLVEGCSVIGCGFNPLAGGTAGAIDCGTSAPLLGLLVSGGWMGDATVTTGTWISTLGDGITITGVRIGNSGAIIGIDISNDTTADGITIFGNSFVPTGVAIKLGSGLTRLVIMGNGGITTAAGINGTPPTGCILQSVGSSADTTYIQLGSFRMDSAYNVTADRPIFASDIIRLQGGSPGDDGQYGYANLCGGGGSAEAGYASFGDGVSGYTFNFVCKATGDRLLKVHDTLASADQSSLSLLVNIGGTLSVKRVVLAPVSGGYQVLRVASP